MADVQDAKIESDVCKAIYTLARIDLWVYCLQLDGLYLRIYCKYFEMISIFYSSILRV